MLVAVARLAGLVLLAGLWVCGCCVSLSEGADTRTLFFAAIPLDVEDFGSLHQKLGVGGRDGSDGWRSTVPRGDTTGERVFLLLPPTIPVSGPPNGCERRDASWCWRWPEMCFQTGVTLRRHFSRAVAAAVTLVHVVAATVRLVVAAQAARDDGHLTLTVVLVSFRTRSSQSVCSSFWSTASSLCDALGAISDSPDLSLIVLMSWHSSLPFSGR